MRRVLAVIVRGDELLSWATNLQHECKREGYPTGEGYELCEGCQPHNHAEQLALKTDKELTGAILYLFGHYYACKPCVKSAKARGVQIVLDKITRIC